MAVYSSKTGSWRLCGYVEIDFRLLSYQCVIWNGCLNWIKGITFYYFNIAQQVLKTSRLSDEMQKYRTEPEYFEECMGHIYLILRNNKVSPSNCYGVFEMEIDYSGWKPICQLDLSGLANHYYGKGRYLSSGIISKVVVKGDGDELKALLIHLRHKFISYDLKLKSFQEIWDFQQQMSPFIEDTQPAVYIGSFANV